MNKRVTTIIDEARKLTVEEREELLLRLRLEFEDEAADGTPEEIEAAWLEEAERRVASFERGESTCISHEEGMAELRKLIPGK